MFNFNYCIIPILNGFVKAKITILTYKTQDLQKDKFKCIKQQNNSSVDTCGQVVKVIHNL